MGRNAPVDPYTEWTRKDKLIAVAVLSTPIWLAIILSIIGDIDARRTQEKLDSRPTTTWLEVLTPEEKQKFGLDRYEEMEQHLKSGNSGNTIHRTNANDYSVTDFDHEDIYDIIEYNDGLDGEFSDIDYHEIEDIFCD